MKKMRYNVETFNDLKKSISECLDKILEDQGNFYSTGKIMKDNNYSYRIENCIAEWYYSNEKHFTNDKLNEILSNGTILETFKLNFANIMKLMKYINVGRGFDFQLSKKNLCMLLGIRIADYQMLLESPTPIGFFISDIEEWLISNKMNSAETSTRNIHAINNNLKIKGKYGGFNVEQVSSKVLIENDKKDVLDYKNTSQVKAIASKYIDLLAEKKKS